MMSPLLYASPDDLPPAPAVLFCGPGTLYLTHTPRVGDPARHYQMVTRNSQFQVTFSVSNEYLSRHGQEQTARHYGDSYLLSAYADFLRETWRARQQRLPRHS